MARSQLGSPRPSRFRSWGSCGPSAAGSSWLTLTRSRSQRGRGNFLFRPVLPLPSRHCYRAGDSVHHVQSPAVGRAEPIDHGIRSVGPDPHRVYHQRVAFVTANSIPIPGWCHLRRMRLVHPHAADFIRVGIEDRDLVRVLEHLHSDIRKNKRYRSRPTLVVTSGLNFTENHRFEIHCFLAIVAPPRLHAGGVVA